jgi:hypothetical protein
MSQAIVRLASEGVTFVRRVCEVFTVLRMLRSRQSTRRTSGRFRG